MQYLADILIFGGPALGIGLVLGAILGFAGIALAFFVFCATLVRAALI